MLQQKQPDLQPFVDRLTSRSTLSPDEQAAIMGLPIRMVEIAPNHDLVRLGERTDHAAFVASGLVARVGQTSQGAKQITALHIAGDMPDLLSVVQPAAAFALEALSTTTVLRVPHAAIKQVLARYPAIAEALWRHSAVEANILAQWLTNTGRRNAKGRLAHLLCEMAIRCGKRKVKGSIVYNLPMTQVHFADATGLTPVHVNRSLKALKEVGVADSHKTVRIEQWDKLANVADFDSGYLQTECTPDDRIRILAPVS